MEGLNITFTDKTVQELETIFTKENCSKIQLATRIGEVYGIYNNLEGTSIIKNLENNNIDVNLKELNTLEVKVEQLQATVDTLVVSGLEG
ncbi:hypothetical protein FDC27_09860 [Clostridium botulinum]|uniref:hypothetical protein n=1 Tax=Clostridium botulinum TaxID=1491 RepID=UPI0013CA3D18|nr:hypothetical protein [Clostridium botulinum]MBY7025065.1 hypothetical protein [Clostridium botulinum]NFE73844.1 hypothetical protein [Clostridium botulinum]NFG26052.1 hypothetical protein [Clostridium botulinum]NFL60523.1 hypothetical protein [Clostridium botulinum]NFL63747.1 hypothetical protein [Clostridium botulinum]